MLPETTKYSKWYNSIIEKAQNDIQKGYTENHHILPNSIFPDLRLEKSNIVKLTARQHYVAHFLLMKHYKKLGATKEYHKMAHAFNMMNISNKFHDRGRVGAYSYESARKNHAEAVRVRQTGRIKTAEERKKLSVANLGKVVSEESKLRMSIAQLNIPKEVRDKMSRIASKVHKGKKLSEEHIRIIKENNSGERNCMFGKTHSPEARKKISEARKNAPRVECPHCGKIGDNQNMSRWHFDNCKLNKNNERVIEECPHCGKLGTNNMKRYHFDNCKFK